MPYVSVCIYAMFTEAALSRTRLAEARTAIEESTERETLLLTESMAANEKLEEANRRAENLINELNGLRCTDK